MNYTVSSGTLFEDFETIGDWTKGANGTIAADTTYFRTGARSVKMVSSEGGEVFMTKTISLSGLATGIWGFYTYIPVLADTATVTIYLSSTTDFSAYFSKQFGTGLNEGWNFLALDRESWGNTGGESWSNTMVRLRMRTDAQDDRISTVYMDSLYYGSYARPKVVMVFDDCFSSAYTEGFSYMQRYGMKGTFGVISSTIGTAGYMTLAQLQTAHAAGWDCVNHSVNHTNLSTLTTAAEQVAEIAPCTEYLASHGFARNNEHRFFIYPQGGYNSQSFVALEDADMLTARSIKARNQATVKGIDNAYLLKARELQDGTSLATAKGWLDSAIGTGETMIYFAHKLVETPGAATEWPIADFRALIDYIASKGAQVDVMPLSDWYAGLTLSRRVC